MSEAAVGSPVRVGVLGTFEASVGGATVQIQQGRLRVLLAVLALSAGRAVSVERLADAAWGADLPANARRAVQTYITRLRYAIGADAITTEPSGYVLRTSPDHVDALRFVRLAERAAQEADVERELLAEALHLWRGKAFDGLESDWLRDHEGVRLEERRLAATERRLDLDFEAGRVASAVSELRELCSAHPLRESLWRRLLIALARTGRQAEALEQYEVIRLRIADELGVDPGAELQGLHADLLTGSVAATAADGQPAPFLVPRQLPADISRFAGRGALLARLDDLLASGEGQQSTSIVAVHGSGGMGKTTLVVHWAHRVAERFPDGQLYLNLRGYGPGEPMSVGGALDILLRGLGVDGEQLRSGSETGENLLRSILADRRMLVILDNARNADQIRPLLPGTGPSLVVVTSRSQLRGLVAREGAVRVGVDQLEPAESTTWLAATLGSTGATDEAALVELAERCGHLPLALVIAAERAGRQGDIGLGGLVAELRAEQERLDTLDIGEEAASLRTVFAWSYRTLDAEVASMFRLLGLHLDSDISLPGAAALAGSTASRVRRLLDRLVDGNLVQQRRPGRYELHDLLRSYAAELAEGDPADDRDAAIDRLLDWYLHSAMSAREIMWPNQPSQDVGRPQEVVSPLVFSAREQALAWLESERTALSAAVGVAADRGQHPTTVGLSNVLWMYLCRRRVLDELLTLQRTTADSARRSDDLPGLAGATLRIGTVFKHQADHEESRAHYERARELYELAGDDVGQGRALSNLSTLAVEMGRYEEAADVGERAIDWLAEAPREQGQGLNNLAVAFLRLGRHHDALETARRAIDVGRDSSLEVEEASALDTLGQALLALGHAEEAVEHLRRARRLLAEVAARWEEGAILANLGRALSLSGDTEGAKAAATEALEIIDELGAPDDSEYNRADLRSLLSGLARESA